MIFYQQNGEVIMLHREESLGRQPVAVVGAGDLVSHFHRVEEGDALTNYRFNVFRLNQELGVSHELRGSDLHDLVKLCQVLAFSISDDGWISAEESTSLGELFANLDALTSRWGDR